MSRMQQLPLYGLNEGLQPKSVDLVGLYIYSTLLLIRISDKGPPVELHINEKILGLRAFLHVFDDLAVVQETDTFEILEIPNTADLPVPSDFGETKLILVLGAEVRAIVPDLFRNGIHHQKSALIEHQISQPVILRLRLTCFLTSCVVFVEELGKETYFLQGLHQ